MALVMYFTRAPRYKNITYENMKLINSFFNWKRKNEMSDKYRDRTFEQWCGHSESELPNLYIMKYFYQFYTEKEMYIEGVGKVNNHSIFEQMARLVKANHILDWFYKNVMDEKASQEYYEVTKEKLEEFLGVCKKVKDCFIITENGKYIVDENTAQKLLPTMENPGFFFGSNSYDETYASHIIEVIDVLENILKTTDFENQTIYFNAIW